MTEIDLPECPHKEKHTFKEDEQRWFGLHAVVSAYRIKKFDVEDQVVVASEDEEEIDEAANFSDASIDLVESLTSQDIYQCGDCREYFVLDVVDEGLPEPQLKWREVGYQGVEWR